MNTTVRYRRHSLMTLVGAIALTQASIAVAEESAANLVPKSVLISAPQSDLLERLAVNAAARGHEVSKITRIEPGSQVFRFSAAEPEVALVDLLRSVSHLIEYDADGSIVRVIVIGAGDGTRISLISPEPASEPEEPRSGTGIVGTSSGADERSDDRTFDVQSVLPEEAVVRLEHALGSRRTEDRAWAVAGLGEFGLRGDDRAVLALGQVLFSEPSRAIREDAADWLRTIGSDAAAHLIAAAPGNSFE